MDWVFIKSHVTGDFARFLDLKNYDDDYQLDLCVTQTAAFPKDAYVPMDPDTSDRIALPDSLRANGSLLIVNDRARKVFEGLEVSDVEWLPVAVVNHKKKPVKDKYYVMNLLTSVDCVDTKKSNVTWNDIDPESISEVKKLVFDAKRLPRDSKLFRPVRMPYAMLCQRSLAQAIADQKLTGFQFTEVAAYVR